MYKVLLLNDALEDLDEIVAYYESQQSGLGRQFLDAYFQWEGMVSRFPRMFPIYQDAFRSGLIKRFSYTAYYQVDDAQQEIHVLAVISQLRDEGYLRRRLR